ncbi:hypothetical protein ZIOFF_019380 [Zingiber officinale]|uniref:Uncharacterized protein n=1 Tax=Zingiber officinale TaxID=94328 RepID=A0A8J5HRL2_ZINOF|nr:hypothetical protein ZIOFF_019380 [Zingiber officinale]
MMSLRALALIGASISGILSFGAITSADEAEHGLPAPKYPWPHKGILSSYDHASSFSAYLANAISCSILCLFGGFVIEERGMGMENSIYIPLQLLHSKLERWLAVVQHRFGSNWKLFDDDLAGGLMMPRDGLVAC